MAGYAPFFVSETLLTNYLADQYRINLKNRKNFCTVRCRNTKMR